MTGLSKMKDLQYLDLHGNTLTGEMPHELANLQRLLYLDLTYNQLKGIMVERASHVTIISTYMLHTQI